MLISANPILIIVSFMLLYPIMLSLIMHKGEAFLHEIFARRLSSMAPKPGNFDPKAVEVMSVIDNFSVVFFLIEYTVSA